MRFLTFSERGETHNGSVLWTPFQDTANLVTILYKGSIHPITSVVVK